MCPCCGLEQCCLGRAVLDLVQGHRLFPGVLCLGLWGCPQIGGLGACPPLRGVHCAVSQQSVFGEELCLS